MRSVVRLLNYGSAAMIVVPIVAIVIQGITWLDQQFHVPTGWVPFAAIAFVGSIAIFDWSSKRLDNFGANTGES